MPIKSDQWIEKMAFEKRMIEPFEKTQIRGGISFGLSSYGYDFRLSSHFKILKEGEGKLIDPKNFSSLGWKTVESSFIDILPKSFILGQSLEYFHIPRNILTICYGKSTYARCGIFVNVTPFEPEWEGHATLAISNLGSLPARVYANEGIAQLLFLESDELCATSYADKQGKYQAQKEITGAKI